MRYVLLSGPLIIAMNDFRFCITPRTLISPAENVAAPSPRRGDADIALPVLRAAFRPRNGSRRPSGLYEYSSGPAVGAGSTATFWATFRATGLAVGLAAGAFACAKSVPLNAMMP